MPLGINGACRTPNYQPLPDIGGPAPGFRDRANGALVSIGIYGFSWSSATGGINGVDLNFNSQYLNTSYSGSRAYGLQLRCLSE